MPELSRRPAPIIATPARPLSAHDAEAGTDAVASAKRAPILSLDVLRGVAALAVMFGHLRALYFVPWGDVAHPSIAARAAYFATGFGHQAVMVFFVLSGYLVGGSVLRSCRTGSWSWSGYFSRRVARLYVVLAPALLLGLAWDHLGIALFGATGVYRGLPADAAVLPFAADAQLGLATLVGNLAFLQTILVPAFGSNGPLWSLAYEWWYYVAFPLLAVPVFAAGGSRAARLALPALAVTILAFAGRDIAIYFAVWLLGVGLARAERVRFASRARRRIALIGAACCLGALLLVTRLSLVPALAADLALGVGVYLFLLVLLARTPDAGVPGASRSSLASLWSSLAGISYTLYVVHMPLLVFGHAAVLARGGSRWQPSLTTLGAAAMIAAVVLGYAWVVASRTELRTDTFRRTIVEPSFRRLGSIGLLPSRGRR